MTDRLRSRVSILGVSMLIGLSTIDSSAFEFNAETSCVLLNAGNTDILSEPADCSEPDNLAWCNCARSALTNPVRGEATAFEQGIIWVTEQPGIANHRITAGQGTLDVSGIAVGAVVGTITSNELVPQSVGVPPGTFFTTRYDLVVTAIDGDVVDIDVVLVAHSPVVRAILRYDPRDAAHSGGLLYTARLTALGSQEGFVFEYRYEAREGATSPAIEPGDVEGPGFNVRSVLTLFNEAATGAYSFANDDDFLEVTTTIRKMGPGTFASTPEEILPLGAEDLCVEIGVADPCRQFEEEFDIEISGGGNTPPRAVVVVTDPLLVPLDGGVLFLDCGEARAIFRGSNSSDGNGGTQGLTFLWEIVDEPDEGAAQIPAGTESFRDTEISFLSPGAYVVRLTVDDGQAENSTDSVEVEVTVDLGIGPNLPPEITSITYLLPDAAAVELLSNGDVDSIETSAGPGSLTIRFNSSANTGADGCLQEETYLWTASGPASVEFSDPTDDDTNATFPAAGSYVVTLTVDDGAPEDNLAEVEIVVEITPSGVGPFLRGDCNQAGQIDISSAIRILNFLFVGGGAPGCLAACDTNGSGQLTISSAVYLLSFLFSGGAAPPAPNPDCGVSARASDVELGCEEPTGCRAA